jgi:hypothetical protein
VSANMDKAEIHLGTIKAAVDAILDHLIQDLGLETVAVDPAEDFYWDFAAPDVYDSSKKPQQLEAGRLSDDLDFVQLIRREQSASVSYSLVHVAPLLRYIGEKIKR